MDKLKYIILVLLSCKVLSLHAQTSGYLGALNGIQIKTNLVPSQAYTAVNKGSKVLYRWKFINPSFTLSYSRVLSRNIEVSGGYQFAKVNFYAGHKFFGSYGTVGPAYWGYNPRFSKHASALYHGGFVVVDFYRFGSIAPIGKYIGFSLSSGVTKLSENTSFNYFFPAGSGVEGFFSTSYKINQQSTTVPLMDTMTVRSFHIKVRMGRNYPVTDRLMISVGMSAPIWSTYRINKGIKDFGFQVKDRYDLDFFNDLDDAWEEYAKRSIKAYHLLQVEVGLRFCL